jgi:two-component system KDP operon response regulator KdpE
LVSQVRRKLEPDPAHPVYLVTRPGLGYVLVASPEVMF